MDPISDMLIRIKNAQAVKKETVAFGHSKMKWNVAKVLEKIKYLGVVTKKGKKNKKMIEVELLYGADGVSAISGVRRISKPSRRVYRGFREVYPVRNGFGMAVYSTPRGLMTDKEIRKEKIGGEVLFEIW